MDSDLKPRINAAQHLYNEIIQIGALEQRRSPARVPGETDNNHSSLTNGIETPQGGALAVSPPNSLSGRLLRVVVSDSAAKADLSHRLYELKTTLLDHCERQLADLHDTMPTGDHRDVEDADRLLIEMRTLRQGMETIVAIEGALEQS